MVFWLFVCLFVGFFLAIWLEKGIRPILRHWAIHWHIHTCMRRHTKARSQLHHSKKKSSHIDFDFDFEFQFQMKSATTIANLLVFVGFTLQSTSTLAIAVTFRTEFFGIADYFDSSTQNKKNKHKFTILVTIFPFDSKWFAMNS